MSTSDEAPKGRVIITVLGSDRPGIVAAVAGMLSDHDANILDISQTILQGTFTMTMLVEVDGLETTFASTKSALDDLATQLGVQITMQREEVFRFMYRL